MRFIEIFIETPGLEHRSAVLGHLLGRLLPADTPQRLRESFGERKSDEMSVQGFEGLSGHQLPPEELVNLEVAFLAFDSNKAYM